MKILPIGIACIFILFSTCKKDKEEFSLPPISSEGKNTFGCKINGKIFISTGQKGGMIDPLGVNYNKYIDSTVSLFASENKPTKGNFYFEFYIDSFQRNFRLMNTKNYASVYLPVDNYVLSMSKFKTNDTLTGSLNLIRFDELAISGTFEFNAIDSRGEMVSITEGRFDIARE